SNVHIFADNSAAVLAIQNPEVHPAQLYSLDFRDRRQELEAMGIQVEGSWIPSHMGIEGNERADGLAKEAA
ncbi:hypothetical protein SISNIDRAFT_399553, partial [Sistotremastrum niveocremeum HHB9708]